MLLVELEHGDKKWKILCTSGFDNLLNLDLGHLQKYFLAPVLAKNNQYKFSPSVPAHGEEGFTQIAHHWNLPTLQSEILIQL